MPSNGNNRPGGGSGFFRDSATSNAAANPAINVRHATNAEADNVIKYPRTAVVANSATSKCNWR